jgi:rhomboid protease GluP
MTAAPARPRQPTTWITYALIAANLVMFGVELAAGADAMNPDSKVMLRLGADYGPLTLGGQWWRLVSSMFLHFGVLHLGMNMLVLYQGRIVEVIYGRAGFVAIYLAAGLLGGIASLAHASTTISAGASGAVFGVFGAFGAFIVLRRGQLDPAFVQRTGRSLIAFIAINLYIGLSTPGIDISAHIGGLVAGFVAGVVLLAGKRADTQRTARSIAIIAATLVVTAGALLVMPKPTDVNGLLSEFDQVQEACLTRLHQAADLPPEQLADALDHDILPRWRTLRADVDAAKDVPARYEHLFAAMRTYLADRQEQWETASKIAHGDRTLSDRAHALGDKVEHDVADVDDAVNQLKP